MSFWDLPWRPEPGGHTPDPPGAGDGASDVAGEVVAFLDTRYEQFICPPPSGPTIREYRHTCPG